MEELNFIREEDTPFNFKYIEEVVSKNGKQQFIVQRVISSSFYNTNVLVARGHHKPISKYIDFDKIEPQINKQ